jgi:nondiscriminating glutamyl-tRNA synthetase
MTVRTRFAPSPTGFLHVGGLRTALYNLLFARHHNGKMVLRIEDTDQERYIEGAVETLLHTLRIMGIDYDEGPDKEDKFGPYVQSKRTKIYQEHVHKLIKDGHAYYCFCTPERLEDMRRKQESAKQQQKYDGLCRYISDQEREQKLKQNIPHVIRLKMPESGVWQFTDTIRGNVSVQNELIDDQILIKSDGFPTYHLANVIDDHYMQITHVIRGEEWLLSVPKHLQLYQAFKWEPPLMAHLPLLLNPDRSKLSKRQRDVAVEEYLKKGYLPECLINFVALLGWNPGTDQEIFTLKQLIEQFSLERVSKAGSIFDIQKLNWMNGFYIREMDEEKRNQSLIPFLKEAGYDISDEQRTKNIISAIHKNLSYGEEIKDKAALFFKDSIEIDEPEAISILQQDASKKVLTTFLDKIQNIKKLDIDIFKKVMQEIQEETGIKKQDLWMPIRIGLTGVTHGPDLPLVIEIFGKEKIQNFVKQILNYSS